MELEILTEIGLTKSEIKVYLAMLKLGQTTSGKIVDEAKITRSKIYDILERLKNKGLVSFITKDSTKYFSAANPNNLLKYIEKKEKHILNEKKLVEKILPTLLLQHKQSNKNKIAEVFIGINGMRNAFNNLVEEFNENEIYYAFGAGEGENIEQIQIFFSNLHIKRKEKKVKSKIIFNNSSKGLFKEQENSKLVELRYIDNSTPAAINIYKDYTIIAILLQEPITFLIRNKETANSFREYFKLIWDNAKK